MFGNSQTFEILLVHPHLLLFPITLQQINRIKTTFRGSFIYLFPTRNPIPAKQDRFGLDLREKHR